MIKKGLRECFVQYKKIDSLREIIKSVISQIDPSPEYDVNVYSDPYSYITLDVSGPSEDGIKSIDLRVMSAIIEICEKESIKAHFCRPLEIVSAPKEKGNRGLKVLEKSSSGENLELQNKELNKRFRCIEEEIKKLKGNQK